MKEPKTGYFSDLLILEIGSVLACPSAGVFFAELGARVIKIENPTTRGDVTRAWKLPGEDPLSDISGYFSSVNWGKESLALDLGAPRGREILRQLVPLADIVLVNFKHGDAEKLGADYDSLKKHNPRLIYGHITGYGKQSPRAGYDAIIQGESGFTFMNGEPNGPPTKLPVALIDILAAHQLKEGLLLALLKRDRTNLGDYVHVSLMQAGIASLANQAANWQVGGQIPGRMGSDHPNIVPYGTIFTTADGKEIVLAVGSDKQFNKLCSILERPDLAENALYSTNQARVLNRETLKPILRELIHQRLRAPFLKELEENNIPAGAVNDMQDVFKTAQAKAMIMQGEMDTGTPFFGLHSTVFSFQEQSVLHDKMGVPPHYGEHTRSILSSMLNMSADDMDSLEKEGVIDTRQVDSK